MLDPVILFFVLGLLAGIFKSGLKVPEVLYETLSIYLLISIGLKGGSQLAHMDLAGNFLPLLSPVVLGILIPIAAYAVLRRGGKFSVANSAAIAAHYGSVSAITFAIVLEFLEARGVSYENYMTVILVLMEIPAILVAILIAKWKTSGKEFSMGKLLHEAFLGKSVYLLLGGLIIGMIADQTKFAPIKSVFFDPFKGILVFFLLEMGLVVSGRLKDLKNGGLFLAVFAVAMPVFSAILGAFIGQWFGLSFGGTVVLATLSASASYIAAPAAVRVAIPEANPALYLTPALVITFPFNIVLGIPLYHQIVSFIYR